MLEPRRRTVNKFTRDGKPVVAKVTHLNGDYLPETLCQAVEMLGGLAAAIRSGDRVLIKPNFNCSSRLPLSTDRAFLVAAIELLQDAGAEVTVGELSGRADWPTAKVVDNLRIEPVLRRYGVRFVNFEHDEWLPLALPGRYWDTVRVPATIYEADRRVYLANMRCHSSARFSASLKLSVGWINLDDRERLHADKETTEAKVAELNLGWQPDLVFVDGRRSTVAWDGRGDYVYPNVVMASGDMVAIDTEAVKILQRYPERNKITGPAEALGQIATAAALGLGSTDYVLLETPGNTRTEQTSSHDRAAVW